MAKGGRGRRVRIKERTCPVGYLSDSSNLAAQAQIRLMGNYVRDHLLDPMVATFMAKRGGIAIEDVLERTGVAAKGMRGIKEFIDSDAGGALVDTTYHNLVNDDELLTEIVRRALLPHTPEGRRALQLASGDAARTYRYAGSPQPHRDWGYNIFTGPFPVQDVASGARPQDFASDKALRDAFSVHGIDLAPRELHAIDSTDVWRTQLTYEHKRQVLDTLVSGQFSLPQEGEIVRYLKEVLKENPRELIEAQWKKLQKADKGKKAWAKKQAAETKKDMEIFAKLAGPNARPDPYFGTDARLLWQEALNENVRRERGLNEGEGVYKTIKDIVDRFAIDDASTYHRRTGALGWKQALYEASEEGFDPAILGRAVEVGARLQKFAEMRLTATRLLDPGAPGDGVSTGLQQLKQQFPEEFMVRPDGTDSVASALVRDLERQQPIDPKVMATLYNKTLQDAQGMYATEQQLQDFLMVAILRQTGMEPRQMARLRLMHLSPDGFLLDPGRKKGGFKKGGMPLSVTARELRIGDDVTGAMARLLAYRQQNVKGAWEHLADDLPLFRYRDEVIPEGKAGQVFGGWRARLANLTELKGFKVVKQDLGIKNFRRYAIARAHTPEQAASILGHADPRTTETWYWGRGKVEAGWRNLSQTDYDPARIRDVDGRIIEDLPGGGTKEHGDGVVPLGAINATLREASDSFLEALALGRSPGRYEAQLQQQISEELTRYEPRVRRLMHDVGLLDDPADLARLKQEGHAPFVQLEVPPVSGLAQVSHGIGRRGAPGSKMDEMQARLGFQGEEQLTSRAEKGGISVERAPQSAMGQRLEKAAATPATALGIKRFAGEPYERRLRQTARDRAVQHGDLHPWEARNVDEITPETDPAAWDTIEAELELLRKEGFTEEFGRARVLDDGQRITLGSHEGFVVPYGYDAAPTVKYRQVKRRRGKKTSPPEAVGWADPTEAEGYFRFFSDAIADADPELLRPAVNRINAVFQEALDMGFIKDPTILERFWSPEAAHLRDPILYRYLVGEEGRALGNAFERQFKPLMDFLDAEAPKGAAFGPNIRKEIAQSIRGQTNDPYRPGGLGERPTMYATKEGGEIHAHRVSQGFSALSAELRQEAIREAEDLVRVLATRAPTKEVQAIGGVKAKLVADEQIRDADLGSPALFDAVSKMAEDRFISDKGKTRDNLSAVINFFSVLVPMVTLPAIAAHTLGVGET